MKLLKLVILIYFITINCYGHKNQLVQKNYGNVKTFLITPFKNYGSTVNIDIIGKLALELSNRLHYKDTIILEFKHVNSNIYPKVTIVEKSKPNNIFLINGDLSYIKKQQRKNYRSKNNGSALCVRQMGSSFNIWEILKLIEFGIKNKFKNDKNIIQIEELYQYTRDGKFELKFYGLKPQLIEKIVSSNKSELLEELSNKKIEFINYLGVKGIFYNNEYCFSTSKIDFKTSTLKYLTKLDKGISVFNSDSSFVYLNDKIQTIKSHKIDANDFKPFYSDHSFNYFTKEKIKEGILLYKAMSQYWVLFSEESNEIIEKCESY